MGIFDGSLMPLSRRKHLVLRHIYRSYGLWGHAALFFAMQPRSEEIMDGTLSRTTSEWGVFHWQFGAIKYRYSGDVVSELRFIRGMDAEIEAHALGVAHGRNHSGIAQALRDYFSGRPERLSQWPIQLAGTDFQRSAWTAIRRIPWGQTLTYGDVARCVGRPGSARAIGRAMGANRIPLFVPCHRVVAAGRRLGGFSPGADLKTHLLGLEGSLPLEMLDRAPGRQPQHE